MKKLVILTILLICSSCSTLNVKTPDCSTTYTRFWFDLEGLDATVCGGHIGLDKTGNKDSILVEKLIEKL